MAIPRGAQPLVDDRAIIMLGSNNYLGLARHPAVVAKVIEAVSDYGLGTGINPCFARAPIHRELERTLAGFLGTEDALLFASCSAANAGVLSTLAGAGGVILSDEFNHASIVDGCRLSRAGLSVYRNRDGGSLRAQLATAEPVAAKLIVTDGVFSTEGTLAPLRNLAEIASESSALLVVDDSHGLGTVGPGGRGSIAAAGVQPSAVLMTGTFSKALGGGCGGYAAGNASAIERLRRDARSFIFTAGMSIADAAGALAALHQLMDAPACFERLWANTRRLRLLLRTYGVPVDDPPSPITPLAVGSGGRAAWMHGRLLEFGVFVPAMAFPVVAEGRAILRIQPSAALSDEDIEVSAQAIAKVFMESQK